MHFDDLSPYTFTKDISDGKARRNVGWLAGWAPFPKAEPAPAFLAALFALSKNPVRKGPGAHVCCKPHQDAGTGMTRASLGDEEILLGAAEIEVASPDGSWYVAPDLIYHYVKEHRYAPPDEFVRACLGA